jgi:hypothetical protein
MLVGPFALESMKSPDMMGADLVKGIFSSGGNSRETGISD